MIDAAADEGEETDAYAGPEMPGLGDGAEVLCGHEQEDGCGKEADDGGAETLEGGFDGGGVAGAQKELAQQLDIGQSELCSFEKCKRQLSMHVICRAFRLLGYELKIILEKVEE